MHLNADLDISNASLSVVSVATFAFCPIKDGLRQ